MIETKKSFFRFSHAFCGVEVDVEGNRVLAPRRDPHNAEAEGEASRSGIQQEKASGHSDVTLPC